MVGFPPHVHKVCAPWYPCDRLRKIGGVATETPDDEFGYPILGSYKHGTDTRFRQARFWEAHIDIPVQLQIEPNDKLRLVLAFSKPSATLVKEEEDGRFITRRIGDVRLAENRLKVVTHDDHVAERKFQGTEFMEWFIQDIPPTDDGVASIPLPYGGVMEFKRYRW
jgi:hypothetical protein